MNDNYTGPKYDIRCQLLGLTGHKGSGKDTVASLLGRDRPHVFRIAFADRLKAVAQDLWGLTRKQVHGTVEDKETVDQRWGVTPRHLLQVLGTEVVRHGHPETWIRALLAEAALYSEGELLVVTDVRFPNEADALRRHWGRLWRVTRPGHGGDGHASETEQARIEVDALLPNDGTLADLEHTVRAGLQQEFGGQFLASR